MLRVGYLPDVSSGVMARRRVGASVPSVGGGSGGGTCCAVSHCSCAQVCGSLERGRPLLIAQRRMRFLVRFVRLQRIDCPMVIDRRIGIGRRNRQPMVTIRAEQHLDLPGFVSHWFSSTAGIVRDPGPTRSPVTR